MAGPRAKSERDMEAEEEEGGSHSPMDQVEAEEDLMREYEDSERPSQTQRHLFVAHMEQD
jgi:hypothetical protein